MVAGVTQCILWKTRYGSLGDTGLDEHGATDRGNPDDAIQHSPPALSA